MSRDIKEEAEKSAKKIINNFSRALEKVIFKKRGIEEGIGGFRAEEGGKECDDKFRKIVFRNAPKKTGRCIVAEVRKW